MDQPQHAAASPAAPAPQDDAPAIEAAPPPVVLEELSGYDDGNATIITQSVVLIGRDGPDLTVRLVHDQWVSSQHAKLCYRDSGWWLEDWNSRNGTWLEGGSERLIAPHPLALGEVFRLGHTDLRLSDDMGLVRNRSQHA